MNWDSDYRDQYRGLFGANPKHWGIDFTNRMDRVRGQDEAFFQNPQGGYNMYGYNEMNQARNHGDQVYANNNAIMDMHRRGYSRDQIRSFVSGERNVLQDGPDWADYRKERRAGMLSGEQPAWTNSYFIGAPEQAERPAMKRRSFLEAYNDSKTEAPRVSSILKELQDYE